LTSTGAGFQKRLYSFLLTIAFLCSCAAVPSVRDSGPSRRIENVPFYPQEIFQCGPASLAAVLNYWGISVSPEQIADEVYSRSAKGTLNVDLVFYAQRMGLKAGHYRGSLEDLKRKIDFGFPLVVMVDDGFWVYEQNHFMTVLGYDGAGVVVHSGKEKGKHIPLDSFLKSWKRAGYWTLLVTK
jgi:predicted double-glycine peptidase